MTECDRQTDRTEWLYIYRAYSIASRRLQGELTKKESEEMRRFNEH